MELLRANCRLKQLATLCTLVFFLSSQAHSSPFLRRGHCAAVLSNALVLKNDSKHQSFATLVGADELYNQWLAERNKARENPDLTITNGSNVRSPEQVEKQMELISKRLHEITSKPDAQKMTMEEFFGLVGSGFDRHGFRINEIFKNFGITQIRLVNSQDFKSIQIKSKDTNEMVLEVPDFPAGNNVAIAHWIANLHLELHQAATKYIAKELDALSYKKAKSEWNNNWKKKLTRMDSGIQDVLTEMHDYLLSKSPGVEPVVRIYPFSEESGLAMLYDLNSQEEQGPNPLRLPEEGLGSIGWYRTRTIGHVAGAAMGGGYIADVFNAVGIKHPLTSYEPSRRWLMKDFEDSAGYKWELKRLDQRMETYFRYRQYATYAKRFSTGVFVVGSLALGGYYLQNQSMVGGAKSGFGEEAKNVAQLDMLTDEQLKNLGEAKLKTLYKELILKIDQIEKLKIKAHNERRYDVANQLNDSVIIISNYAKKVVIQINTYDPDDLEKSTLKDNDEK